MSVGSFSLTFQLHILSVGNTDVIQWGVDFTEVMEIKNKKTEQGKKWKARMRYVTNNLF